MLGIEPYFIRPHPPAAPGYVEFRLGDHQDELGIIDRRYAPGLPPDRPGGAVAFWHVDDLAGTLERLQAMGASVHEPLTDREAGFQTASVVDPFGNILGVMYNPHFLQMLGSPRDR